jgi:hypothetical protein
VSDGAYLASRLEALRPERFLNVEWTASRFAAVATLAVYQERLSIG